MSDFFPDPVRPPVEPEDDVPQPVWLNPPDDVLPGVVPVELIIGRSDQTAVMLTGLRVFPAGLAMTLHVRTRARLRRLDLHDEVFNGPYRHDQDEEWQRGRLKWGFQFADGRRATNVDTRPDLALAGAERTPDHAVLMGRGGGGGDRSVERDYWLWPLPPAGSLTIVCQWSHVGIEPTTSHLDAAEIVAAANRAQPVWPH